MDRQSWCFVIIKNFKNRLLCYCSCREKIIFCYFMTYLIFGIHYFNHHYSGNKTAVSSDCFDKVWRCVSFLGLSMLFDCKHHTVLTKQHTVGQSEANLYLILFFAWQHYKFPSIICPNKIIISLNETYFIKIMLLLNLLQTHLFLLAYSVPLYGL